MTENIKSPPPEFVVEVTTQSFYYAWYERIPLIGKLFIKLHSWWLKKTAPKIIFSGHTAPIPEYILKNLAKTWGLDDTQSPNKKPLTNDESK